MSSSTTIQPGTTDRDEYVVDTWRIYSVIGISLLAIISGAIFVATSHTNWEYSDMVLTGLMDIDINPVDGTYSAFCEVFVPGSLSWENWFDIGHTGTNQTEVIQFAENACVYGAAVSGSCNRHGRCNGQPRRRDDQTQETIGAVLIVVGSGFLWLLLWVTLSQLAHASDRAARAARATIE